MKAKLVLSFCVIILAQGTSALTGLLLARWLSVAEYSIYTVIISASTALTFLTKGGITMGLNSILGRIWPNMNRARAALDAANFQRKRASFAVLPAILLVTAWLLHSNHAAPVLSLVLLALLIVQWGAELVTRNSEQILYFSNNAHRLQLFDSLLACARLASAFTLKYLGFLNVSVAFSLGVLVLIARGFPIRRWLRLIIPLGTAGVIDGEYVNEMRKVFIRQLPMEIFYVLQLQLVLILFSIYGSQSDTAAFGALSRIGQLLAPISVLINTYAIPRFAKSKEDVFLNLFKWIAVASVPGLTLISLAWFSPNILLYLVGPNYSHLQNELLIFCIGVAFNISVTTAFQLAANRGWNRRSYLQVPVVCLWVAICFIFFDLKNFNNILWLLAFVPLGQAAAVIWDSLEARRRKEV